MEKERLGDRLRRVSEGRGAVHDAAVKALADYLRPSCVRVREALEREASAGERGAILNIVASESMMYLTVRIRGEVYGSLALITEGQHIEPFPTRETAGRVLPRVAEVVQRTIEREWKEEKIDVTVVCGGWGVLTAMFEW